MISEHHPLDLLGSVVLPMGLTWAEVATPEQWTLARRFFDGPELGFFATRSRGYSKSEDAAGLWLADALTGPIGARSFWIAADAEQGTLALDSLRGFQERSAWLGDALEVQAKRAVVRGTGAALEILAADSASSWGLRPRGLYCDELANWDETPSTLTLWRSISSAWAKARDSRMLAITTPSDPAHFSHSELEAARASDLWFVQEVIGCAPWLDPAKVEEQRQRLPAPVFEQLFMGRWVPGTGAFLDAETVDAAFTLDGPNLEPRATAATHVAALDLGHTHDASVLAVGHRTASRRVVLDQLIRWQGTRKRPVSFTEVEEAIVRAHERFGLSAIRCDPWQGLGMIERLRGRGVPIDPWPFTTASKQRLASTLLTSLNEHTLDLYPAPGLRDELKGLRLRQQGPNWTFDHARGRHDDMAVALALMAVTAIERPDTRITVTSYMPTGRPPAVVRGGLTLTGNRYLDLTPSGSRVPPPGYSMKETA